MKNTRMCGKKLHLIALLTAVLFFSACTAPENRDGNLLVITGNTMGTTFTVKIVRNNFLLLGNHAEKAKELEAGINALLGEVNRKMSTYIPDSEISMFNAYRGVDLFDISPETATVLSESLRISEMTGGAFDVTVGPLINLWGFGPDRKPVRIPSEKEIEDTKKITGYQNLSVTKSPSAARKSIPEIRCDLSAIAKGYGVDRIAAFLDSRGFYNYLVEIGGEISVRGHNPEGIEWKLGVLSPDGKQSIKKVISIGDQAMATSGDYHNYFEEGGVRYSHTIDPLTGSPIAHKLVSVSVVMPDCMTADALATAINVMGPEKGYAFSVRHNIPVYLIIKGEDGYREKMNPEFSGFLVENRKD